MTSALPPYLTSCRFVLLMCLPRFFARSDLGHGHDTYFTRLTWEPRAVTHCTHTRCKGMYKVMQSKSNLNLRSWNSPYSNSNHKIPAPITLLTASYERNNLETLQMSKNGLKILHLVILKWIIRDQKPKILLT